MYLTFLNENVNAWAREIAFPIEKTEEIEISLN